MMEMVPVRVIIQTFVIILSCVLIKSDAYTQESNEKAGGIQVSRDFEQLREAYIKSAYDIERAAALAAWEEALVTRIMTDTTYRKGKTVIPLIKPAEGGAIIRCTLCPSYEYEYMIVATLEATGDQIPHSGFQSYASGSIFRFSGSLYFPFRTRVPFEDIKAIKISGYLVRDDSEYARALGVTNSQILFPSHNKNDWIAHFIGNPKDPLSFILLDDGLVHLHGEGFVRPIDGKESIKFGNN